MDSDIEDPQVGYLRGSDTPIYQSRLSGGLYFLDHPPKRYIQYRHVEFLTIPTKPVPQQPTRQR
jgi:hypothetical protein